jgi:hypothetical protein
MIKTFFLAITICSLALADTIPPLTVENTCHSAQTALGEFHLGWGTVGLITITSTLSCLCIHSINTGTWTRGHTITALSMSLPSIYFGCEIGVGRRLVNPIGYYSQYRNKYRSRPSPRLLMIQLGGTAVCASIITAFISASAFHR